MIFSFFLYKLFSNFRLESSFFYFIIFYLYLHIPIKFSSLYFANLLLFIYNSRLYLLSCVFLFSASAKFVSLKFAALSRVDIVSVACAGISIILSFLIYILVIQSVLSVDAVLQQDIIIK